MVLPRKLNALLAVLGGLALSWHVPQQRIHHAAEAAPVNSHLQQTDSQRSSMKMLSMT